MALGWRSLLLCFLLPLNLFAQDLMLPAKPALRINNLVAVTRPNLHAFDALRNEFIHDHFNQRFYALMQFDQLPDANTRRLIAEETGIRFFTYLPDAAYFVSVPSDVNIAPLFSFHVRGMYRVMPSYKIATRLLQGGLPSPLVHDDGSVDVTILAYKDADQEKVLNAFEEAGFDCRPYSSHYNIFHAAVQPHDFNTIASLPFVQYVEEGFSPAKPDNLNARTDHRSDLLDSDIPGALHYDGSGVYVALNDDGEIGPHIDFQARYDNTAVTGIDQGNHGDHIAGTIAGAGNLVPRTQGHADGAILEMYLAYDGITPVYSGWFSIPDSYLNPGVTITNTAVSDLICNEGYNALSQLLDEQANDYPALLHVLSAGNSGNENCGILDGWFNITGGHKQAKDCITVGNVDRDDKIDPASSKGPATDGRLKPDCVAEGVDVYSTFGDNGYKSLSGTSMSCAGVSGVLAQLTQAYRDLNNGETPRSDLLKADLLNTSDDLGWGGPDFKHGWGRINARRAFDVLNQHEYFFDSLDNGGQKSIALTVPANVKMLRVMLYWNDAPASLGAPKDLVNDLQLQLAEPGGQLFDPWILDHTANKDSLNKRAWRGIDSLNNAEQVTLNNPAQGSYQIMVNGVNVPEGPQHFVVVYEFQYDEITLTYPNGGQSWAPLDDEVIRWDSYGLMSDFKLEISYDSGATWNLIADNIDSVIHDFDFMVPPVVSGNVLVRVSRNGVSDVSDYSFSIMTPPEDLHIDTICPLNVRMDWDSVPGASSYAVYKLGEKYMEQVGETGQTHFDFSNLDVNQNDWFTVRAIGNDHAESRRAIAIEKPTGLLNCTINNDVSVIHVSPEPGNYTTCMNLGAVPVTMQLVNDATNTMSNLSFHCRVDSGIEWVLNNGLPLDPSDTLTVTFSEAADIASEGSHVITCWVEAPGDENPWNDTVRRVLIVNEAAAATLPYVENFNDFTNCETGNDCSEGVCALSDGWMNLPNLVYDSIDWRTNSGSTPGADTGPDEDFDLGNADGHYLYLEAGGCNYKEAQLLTPCFDLTTATIPFLTFAYHMYGSQMGSLHVDVFASGNWHNDLLNKTGDQGDNWLTDTIDLSAYAGGNITLRFRGITGNGSESDMAIDDISVFDAAVITPSFIVTGINCADSVMTVVSNSVGWIQNYQWDFGADAYPQNASGVSSVNVTYATAGNKMISLTASNMYAAADSQQYLELFPAPEAVFNSVLNYDGSFTFNNQSQNATGYEWDFGDGDTSTQVNPTHTFSGPGSYVVHLTASGNCGIDSASQSIVFTNAAITSSFNDITVSPNPFHDGFTISMKGSIGFSEIDVAEVSGKTIFHRVFTSGSMVAYPVRLEQLPAGFYWLQVLAGDEKFFAKLIKW